MDAAIVMLCLYMKGSTFIEIKYTKFVNSYKVKALVTFSLSLATLRTVQGLFLFKLSRSSNYA